MSEPKPTYTPPRYDDLYFNEMSKMDDEDTITQAIDSYILYVDNCVNVMARMPDNHIDMTCTSPPYDNLRTYGKDFDADSFDWKPIIKELYRVTAVGGVVVWVVADATINGSETGTSFRQALWAMECGFRLHDTMIYQQAGTGAKGSNYAYWQSFEYMFIFSKDTPKTVNRIADIKNTKGGKLRGKNKQAKVNGSRMEREGVRNPIWSVRPNIWRYAPSVDRNDTGGHQAPFPEALANDHIISWSSPGDLVFDCFLGSGTTGKMAIRNGRKFVGCDIEAEYVDIARKRIEDEVTAVLNRGDDFTTTEAEKSKGQLAIWDLT